MEGQPLLSEEEKKRAVECSAKITALLKEYNCEISARCLITNEFGTQIQTAIIPKSSIIQPLKKPIIK